MKWIPGMAMGLVLFIQMAWGGNLDSPGTPPSAGSGLYPLQALYDYLDSGSPPTPATTFQGPMAPPGSTGKTTNEIYDHIRSQFEACDVTPNDVVDTATFFSTDPADWGPRRGAMTTQTLDPGTTNQVAGLYGAFDLSAVDPDLNTANIRSGTTVFGLAGDPNVLDTAETTSPASAGEILAGQRAFVNGAALTGTMPDGTLSDTTTAVPEGFYAATDLASVDPDLTTGNIRSGTTVFGLAGDPNVLDTTETTSPAAAGQILAGQRAFVNGAALTGTMPDGTLSDTTTAVPEGYYAATDLASVDPDLITGNIRSGATVFGVAGDPNVVDTAETTSPAASGQILAGQRAFVNGAALTGTMPDGTLSDTTTAVPEGFYAATDLASVDPDLITGNIRSGTTVFGLAGDPNVVNTSSGDAVSGEILSGKTAWVDGAEITGTGYPAPVEQTGQTTCYDQTGTVVPCAGTGQDGEYQKGVTPPSPRFTDNGDGTVTDNLTGLIWLQNSDCADTVGGVTGPAMIWLDAPTFSNNLADGDCGLTDGSASGDWRLPNIKELLSLIDRGQSSPAMPPGHPFTVVLGVYWSSSTDASNPGFAWVVEFSRGDVYNGIKGSSNRVRAVRGGQ